MTAKEIRKLKLDTIVRIGWLDIMEDSTGDPNTSRVVLRSTIGYVRGVKKNNGVLVLTLSFTKDPDGDDQTGWICFPVSVVREVEVIRLPQTVGPGVLGGAE